jgi:hypothetical protein
MADVPIRRAARLTERLDRPAAPAAVALVGAVVFVVERLIVVAHGHISGFVMAERAYANPARVPRGLVVLPRNGYDGQFFYRLALNPSNLHRRAYGITFDSKFRVQRIGYPVLAWLVSLGQHQWVPLALVLVNLAALAGIGLLGGLFARAAHRHCLWGLLLAGYFGFVFSLGRDIAEPLAAVLLLAGVLAYRRGRPVTAGLLLAYGALTRETVMVAVAAIAVVRIVTIVRGRARPGRLDLAWLVPSAVFAAWQAVVYSVTGSFALGADTSSNTGFPGQAMVHALVTNVRHLSVHAAPIDAWVVEFVCLVAFVAMAAASLRSTTVPVQERLAFVFFIVELFVLSPSIWNGVADLRSLDEVYLFAVLILLGSRRRLVVPALVVAPALLVVVAHRAVSL